MPTVAARVTAIGERLADAPWPNHEYFRGWGVFGLPFHSGHVLALRVVPENSFAPYRTVWHRDPEGRWSIFADATRLDIACPRYYGPACHYAGHARIGVEWTSATTLRITVDQPSLDWTLSVRASPTLAIINAVSAVLPLASWRPGPLVRARERIAHALGMGDLTLFGTFPSGHVGTLMPKRMYYVDRSQATLDGLDLGRPTRVDTNPMIGDVPLPARGVLVIGQAMLKIRDPEEFRRVRALAITKERL